MRELLLIALLLAGTSAARAQELCRVDLGRGWTTGAGQGRIVMRNTGVGCTAVLESVPDIAIPVEDIRLVLRPQHGVVTLAPPRFTYTPNPGFTGSDNFGLAARGLSRDGRPLVLRGDVTVEVR